MRPSRSSKLDKRRKEKANRRATIIETETKQLKVAVWNANGLQCDIKKHAVADVLEEQDIDILGVLETHTRVSNHEDLSMFNGYRTVTIERGYGDKLGGGILVLIKQGIKHSLWSPEDTDNPHTVKEKVWIRIHEGESRLAFGFVYMAAQVPGTEEFKQWNEKMYVSLQKDIDQLHVEGYEAVIMGDLNGHIGNGEDGIPGNLPNVNFNGILIQNFVKTNNMRLVNAEPEITSGLFTRSAGGNSTILDYVLATAGAIQKIKAMEVDEQAEIFMGSDHAGIIITVEIHKDEDENDEDEMQGVRVPLNAVFHGFQKKLDEILNTHDLYDEMSVNEKCILLQEAVQLAGEQEFGHGKKRVRKRFKIKLTKSMKSLRDQQRWLERATKRLSSSKAMKRVAGIIWTNEEENKLKDKLDRLQKVTEQSNTEKLNSKDEKEQS